MGRNFWLGRKEGSEKEKRGEKRSGEDKRRRGRKRGTYMIRKGNKTHEDRKERK